jgi:hypothetical protein
MEWLTTRLWEVKYETIQRGLHGDVRVEDSLLIAAASHGDMMSVLYERLPDGAEVVATRCSGNVIVRRGL